MTHELSRIERHLSEISPDYKARMDLKHEKPNLHTLYACCWALGFTVNGLNPLRYV